MHSTEEILRAAAAWYWVPRDGDQENDELRLVRYPQRLGGGVRASQVRSTRPASDVADHAVARTRSWGGRQLTFWTSPSDSPALEQELLARGAELVDTVAVFARGLADIRSDAVPGPTSEVVHTLEQLREVDAINVPVWRQAPLDEQGLREELSEITKESAEARGFRVLGRVDGRAVSTGGCTLIDGFVRLWGAATLEESRGHGAYRAVLAERLRVGAELGATTALVKGRTAASAPILARAGFTQYGEERAYRMAVD